VTAFLTDALDVAEATTGFAGGLLRREAGGDFLRRELVDVEAEFLVDLLL
jgi:hypothetical protein